MSEWQLTKLKKCIRVKHGFPFKSEFFAETGDFVVLTPGNFYEEGGFKRNEGKDKCYTQSFPEEYLLKKDDLVVAMTEQAEGLLGSAALVPENGKFLHNQRLGLLTAIDPGLDLGFVYHLFKTKTVRTQIRLSASGSKVKHTSPDRIGDVEVRLPPKDIQGKIAKVLSTLDAKITLNRRLNAELEAMAKLLYDYWFVQFDFPISAAQAAAMDKPELEGKPYRTSGGKMAYNEKLKREIPEGWVCKELADIANITMGQSPPGHSYNELREGELFFQGSTDFGWRFPAPRQYTTAPTRIANEGDILLSVRAPVGTLNIAPARCAIGRGLAALRSKLGHAPFLFRVMENLRSVFNRRNTDGTTFGCINRDDLRSLKLSYPADDDLVRKFDERIKPMEQLIFTNHLQEVHLTQLRDWLLPMLMNGQVTVGDPAATQEG